MSIYSSIFNFPLVRDIFRNILNTIDIDAICLNLGRYSNQMKFRPCIDLHAGVVKQIVGSTLTTSQEDKPVENFVASLPAEDFSK